MTISQLEGAGIRKVATKVTTTLNCLEGAVQALVRIGVGQIVVGINPPFPPSPQACCNGIHRVSVRVRRIIYSKANLDIQLNL